MLVLRLMLMVLTIICLMDGHAEVSSSTTGIRNRRESPVVKPNETEVQILDRKKKKKPKKPKKPSKKKKPKPKKPKPAKPVTTTPTMTTSTLKTTTILTTPTVETTATTTDFPTTTATTFKTSTSTATTTEASSSTASTTTATTTIPTTTMTTTATTSSLITTAATTADSGAEGECKATNGKPCIFPFKDGKEEYNECKNHGGTYFWCATAVYDSGKYKHWSYCPKDGPCPLEGDEECRATNNKPCVFPFKDGKNEYNECADHGGQYFWCATGTNSVGKYTAWSECPKDGSCPLPQKSTTPAMTSTATAASTTGTTVATDQMEEKVLGTLENLVLGESRDDSLQMAHMLEKKLDTIIKDLEGETSKSELSNFDDIPPQSGKLNLTLKRGQDGNVRDGSQLGKGLMFVLSTVDSMKSVSRVSGDCCLDCTSKDPHTELAEYWETLDTCYCYKKFKNPDVEPKTRASSKFTTKACATAPSPMLTWDKGMTSFFISDGNKEFKCNLDIEFHVEEYNIFLKGVKSECTESTSGEDSPQYVGKHDFILTSNKKTNFYCSVNIAMSRGILSQNILEDSLECVKATGCSSSRKQNELNSAGLRVWPAVDPANDMYYAEHHGFFIIKMFQELARANTNEFGNELTFLKVADEHTVLESEAVAAAAAVPAENSDKTPMSSDDEDVDDINDPNGIYLFFLGPPELSIENSATALWTRISAINDKNIINNEVTLLLPYYIGKSKNLNSRFNDHMTKTNHVIDRFKKWIKCKTDKNFKAGITLYYTRAITDTETQALFLEKLFLDSFDFPINVVDNKRGNPWTYARRLPMINAGNLVPTKLPDKFGDLASAINRNFLTTVDKILGFIYLEFKMLDAIQSGVDEAQLAHINTIKIELEKWMAMPYYKQKIFNFQDLSTAVMNNVQ